TPINEIASKLNEIQSELIKLNKSKELGVYWFAKKNVELAEIELIKCNERLEELNIEINQLRAKETELGDEVADLKVQIKSDEVGNQIEKLKAEIIRLEKSRDSRKTKLDQYNKLVQSLELNTNPSEETFKVNRAIASEKKSELELKRQESDEKLRLSKNKRE